MPKPLNEEDQKLRLLLGFLEKLKSSGLNEEATRIAELCLELVWSLKESVQGISMKELVAKQPEGYEVIAITSLLKKAYQDLGVSPHIVDAGLPIFFGVEEAFRKQLLGTIEALNSVCHHELAKHITWQIANLGSFGLELTVMIPDQHEGVTPERLTAVVHQLNPSIQEVVPGASVSWVHCSIQSGWDDRIMMRFPALI